MTLEEIDNALADWQAKLDIINANLVALTELPAYQLIQGRSGQPSVPLIGFTAGRVEPVRERIVELWSLYAQFADLIQQAVERRRTISRLRPAPQILSEIEQLVQDDTVLPPNVTTLPQLLGAMVRSFQEVRNVVVALDTAREQLAGVLAAHEAEATALQQQAEVLGEAALPELAAAQPRLAALQTQLASDPLGANTASEEIRSMLQQVRARLDKLSHDRGQLPQEFAAARLLLKQLEEHHGQARQAYAERTAKVSLGNRAEFPRPLDDEAISALGPWLTKLEATWQEGKWKPVLIGIRKWTDIAKQYLSTEEAAKAANEAPLRERQDLRGLLDALKAKARANGRGEDAELAALAQQTWQLLHSRPTPLDQARQLVTEYESRLM